MKVLVRAMTTPTRSGMIISGSHRKSGKAGKMTPMKGVVITEEKRLLVKGATSIMKQPKSQS